LVGGEEANAEHDPQRLGFLFDEENKVFSVDRIEEETQEQKSLYIQKPLLHDPTGEETLRFFARNAINLSAAVSTGVGHIIGGFQTFPKHIHLYVCRSDSPETRESAW
jgi:hypothetical protein